MAGYETFLEELQRALNHLNDPAFWPTPRLCQILGLPPASSEWANRLRQSVQDLKPPPTLPSHTRGQRLYQVLLHRYIHNETQERVAVRLHITARHLRREQNEAVQALARLLWERRTLGADELAATDASATGWSAQLRQELTALQQGASSGTVALSEAIRGVVELLAPVLQKSGVALRVSAVPSGLAVAVQSIGLRQLLVRTITEWSRHLTDGEIDISADRSGEQVVVRLVGSRAAIEYLPDDPLLQELLNEFGGSMRVEQANERSVIVVNLAMAPPVRVLVVDDNEDLLHFYRRYVANTRYQIIPLTEGERVFEALEETQSDVIILDVMLPTVDGWELLTRLRQHPLGRTIPILICSVIQEEELAHALGASGYIRKPVGRSSLLHALDAAMGQAGLGFEK